VKDTLEARIYDRLTVDWLTPSQKKVWEALQRFDGPPHQVVNVYGAEGTGKTFTGWLLERLGYSTYCVWPDIQKPLLPRLTLDDSIADRFTARSVRPLVEDYGIRQIVLLSRIRVDEKAMPVFELRVTEEDIESFRANLYRHLNILLPEAEYRNYKAALTALL